MIDEHDLRILSRIESKVKVETESTIAVLDDLIVVYDRAIHLALGYPSLFKFCVVRLGYSDASASRRAKAALIMRQFPEVRELLLSGELSVTNLSMAAPYFSEETKDEILCGILGRSKAEASLFLEAFNAEGEERRIELRFSVPEEMGVKIETVKSVLSRKLGTVPTMEEVFTAAVNYFVERHDPEARMKRRERKTQILPPGKLNRHIPNRVRDQVMIAGKSCCEFKGPDGTRCESTIGLQIDHCLPFALGGTHDPSNLRVLCSNHNRFLAERTFGKRTDSRRRGQWRVPKKLARTPHAPAASVPGANLFGRRH